jgi:hypothetical protein
MAGLLAGCLLGSAAAQNPAGESSSRTPQQSASTPAPASASQPETLPDEAAVHARELRWERLMELTIEWAETAARMKAQNKMPAMVDATRTRLQKQVGLTEDQGEWVVRRALQWRDDRDDAVTRSVAVVAAVRKTHPGEHLDHTNCPEISEAYEERWRVTDRLLGDLKNVLGSKAFARMEEFTYHSYQYPLHGQMPTHN